MAQEMSKGTDMKAGWKTHAIGRHLVDVPGDAKLIEGYKINKVGLEPLPEIKMQARFDLLVSERERVMRTVKPNTKGSFIERVPHANGAVTLISWDWKEGFTFDTYFRAGTSTLKYSGDEASDWKSNAIKLREELSREWRELRPGEIPEGMGFVAGNMMLADNRFNPESWSLVIQLAGKPDVSLEIAAFAVGKVNPEQTLRKRAGGIVAGMLGLGLGLVRLRNRERPVGPIWAEEILVAGTQNGKRAYGFKWEAPGKANSLAEPQLNVELEVGESAYETNKESFANDDEALALWDAIVDSIRLRPGAA